MPGREYTNEEILALLHAEPEKSSLRRELKPARSISWGELPQRKEEERELAMRNLIRDNHFLVNMNYRTFKGYMMQYCRGDKSKKKARVWYAWGIYVKMEQERLLNISLEAEWMESTREVEDITPSMPASPSVNDLKSLLDEGNDLLLNERSKELS